MTEEDVVPETSPPLSIKNIIATVPERIQRRVNNLKSLIDKEEDWNQIDAKISEFLLQLISPTENVDNKDIFKFILDIIVCHPVILSQRSVALIILYALHKCYTSTDAVPYCLDILSAIWRSPILKLPKEEELRRIVSEKIYLQKSLEFFKRLVQSKTGHATFQIMKELMTHSYTYGFLTRRFGSSGSSLRSKL